MKKSLLIVSVASLALAPFQIAASQNNSGLIAQAGPASNAPAASPSAPNAPNAATNLPLFSQDELKNLLSPIALYPDPLLAQLLPASAYPLEIVQLARWLEKNPNASAQQDFSGLDAQNWDPTVKAMARFPTIVKKMNDDLDWTSQLGEAFIEQPNDVAQMIQSLRAMAQKSGALITTPQQTVTTSIQNNRETIIIEPSVPDQIYVPAYSDDVYVTSPSNVVAASLLTFGTAIAVGSLVNNATWNWGTGVVYPPVWGGVGWRGGRPVVGGDVNIGSNNLVNHSNIIGNTKPWRPDPQRLNAVQNRNRDGARLDRSNLQARSPLKEQGELGDRAGRLENAPAAQLQRPQNRPAAPAIKRPNNTAFSGIDRGQAAAAFAQRGATSRAQIARPQGGARQAIHAGGGARGGAIARGGGGRRR